jgi:hypothetical protein
LSVAEPRRITRIYTDAEDEVAYLLLPRLKLLPVFQRALCWRPAQFHPMGTVGSRLRLCANRKCKRDCDDECSPHFSFPRVSTVESSLDGKPARYEERRELLHCTGRIFDFVPHEQESNSLV